MSPLPKNDNPIDIRKIAQALSVSKTNRCPVPYPATGASAQQPANACWTM